MGATLCGVQREEHHEEAALSFLSFVFFVSFVVKDRSRPSRDVRESADLNFSARKTSISNRLRLAVPSYSSPTTDSAARP